MNIEVIAVVVPVVVSLLVGIWKLSGQLASINASVEGMREDLREARPMVHDHEKRISVLEKAPPSPPLNHHVYRNYQS